MADTPDETKINRGGQYSLEGRVRSLERHYDRSTGLEGRVKRLEEQNEACSTERLIIGEAIKRIDAHLRDEKEERAATRDAVEKQKVQTKAWSLVLSGLVVGIPIVIEVVKAMTHK